MQPKMELTSALGRTRRCGGEMLSGRIMMVVIVLPVMLRDSSPFIQYIRGQEDGWQRTCVCQSVVVTVCGRLSCGQCLCGVVWRARLVSFPACRDDSASHGHRHRVARLPLVATPKSNRLFLPLSTPTISMHPAREAKKHVGPSFGKVI